MFNGLLILNICVEKSNQALSVITTVDANAPIGGVFITVAKENEVEEVIFQKLLAEIVAEKLVVSHRNILCWKSFISIDTEVEIQSKGNRTLIKFAEYVTLVT